MVHPNTQRFIDDWRARRGAGRAPRRADLAPTDFGRVTPQLFMLGAEADGRELFRLAGGFVTELHGRELQGADFAGLWRERDRRAALRCVALARRMCTPVILTVQAHPGPGRPAEGEPVGLEIVLAPVLGPGGRADRTFGLYQPTSMVARLRGRPVEHLVLSAIVPAAESADADAPGVAGLRLVALHGRRVA